MAKKQRRKSSLALSGSLTYAYMDFTKPHGGSASVLSLSFSNEFEEYAALVTLVRRHDDFVRGMIATEVDVHAQKATRCAAG